MTPLSRRQFLAWGGALLGGLTLGCRGNQSLTPEEAYPTVGGEVTPSPFPSPVPIATSPVLPSLQTVIIEHAPRRAEGLDYFLAQNGVGFDLIRPYEGEPLPPLERYGAVISSGGPMSPQDFEAPEYGFLQEEKRYLLEAIDKGVAILGLCLGHQLLAYALGGEVEKGTEAEVGWFQVALTEEGIGDPLFVGVEQRFYVFQYHIDQVVRLSEGGVNLARSPLCPVQAFRYADKPAWGLQFHPEVRPPQAEEILRGGGRLPVEDVEGMVARGYQVYGPAQAKIFENFFLQARRSLACVG